MEYIDILIEQAKIAEKLGDIPVAALIEKNKQILTIQYNQKHIQNCSTKHAEVLAIEEASKILNNWMLEDCNMYVTMEPCLMCVGALIQSRIKKVYYLVENPKFGAKQFNIYNHKIKFIKINDKNAEEKYKNILKKTFANKR